MSQVAVRQWRDDLHPDHQLAQQLANVNTKLRFVTISSAAATFPKPAPAWVVPGRIAVSNADEPQVLATNSVTGLRSPFSDQHLGYSLGSARNSRRTFDWAHPSSRCPTSAHDDPVRRLATVSKPVPGELQRRQLPERHVVLLLKTPIWAEVDDGHVASVQTLVSNTQSRYHDEHREQASTNQGQLVFQNRAILPASAAGGSFPRP